MGSAAFKAVGTGDPRPAGSIPVHLRHRVHGRPPPTVDIALTAAFFLALGGALVADWRIVLATLLGLAAAALLFLNIRELVRD